MTAVWSWDASTVAAIVGMSLATYACRGGGYWIFRQIRPTPWVRTMLGYVPGTLFVSYVAPALVGGGPGMWAGAVVTAAVMAATRNLSLAILGGVAAFWAIWTGM